MEPMLTVEIFELTLLTPKDQTQEEAEVDEEETEVDFEVDEEEIEVVEVVEVDLVVEEDEEETEVDSEVVEEDEEEIEVDSEVVEEDEVETEVASEAEESLSIKRHKQFWKELCWDQLRLSGHDQENVSYCELAPIGRTSSLCYFVKLACMTNHRLASGSYVMA